MVYIYSPQELKVDSTGNKILLIFASFFLLLILITLASGIFYRGRVILNQKEKSLKFYKGMFWLKLVYCIPLQDIFAIGTRQLDAINVSDDSLPWTYKIIVAEMQDGRFVSIAFDSSPNIVAAICAAAPEYPLTTPKH